MNIQIKRIKKNKKTHKNFINNYYNGTKKFQKQSENMLEKIE